MGVAAVLRDEEGHFKAAISSVQDGGSPLESEGLAVRLAIVLGRGDYDGQNRGVNSAERHGRGGLGRPDAAQPVRKPTASVRLPVGIGTGAAPELDSTGETGIEVPAEDPEKRKQSRR